jgi:hypothetical protein
MQLFETYRLTLRERVHSTKAIALDNPTKAHVADLGRALMEHRANMPAALKAARDDSRRRMHALIWN